MEIKPEQSADLTKKPNNAAVAWVLGLFIVLPLVLIWVTCVTFKDDSKQPWSNEQYAMLCQKRVEQLLKAPATAEFQNALFVDVQKHSESDITVKGYVDAENSFGAKLRTNYVCEMDCSSKQSCMVRARVD